MSEKKEEKERSILVYWLLGVILGLGSGVFMESCIEEERWEERLIKKGYGHHDSITGEFKLKECEE